MYMKKALYIGGFEMPDKNAAAQRVMANALLLREMDYEVDFIGPTKDPSSVVASANGFRLEYVDYPKSVLQWLRYITEFVSLKRILAHKPDIVILYNFPSIASLRILKACHKNGIKVIHDVTEWEKAAGFSPREIVHWMDINLRMRFCLKRMDGIIAISRYLFNYYSRYTNVVIIPPTVDLLNPKWQRSRELVAGDRIRLIYAGSPGGLNKDRLDAIISEVAKFDSVDFDIIGMSKEQYEAVYGPLPKDLDNVRFKGRVPHTEAVEAVCLADFQMLVRDSSRKADAGFPTKFVESMSCCTPLIATPTSNICDYLKDGFNGFVIKEENTLNQIISRIIGMSKEDIVRMKENCRELTCFDYREYRKELEKLIINTQNERD